MTIWCISSVSTINNCLKTVACGLCEVIQACIHWGWLSNLAKPKLTGLEVQITGVRGSGCCRGRWPGGWVQAGGEQAENPSQPCWPQPLLFSACALDVSYWENKATWSMNLCWGIQSGLGSFSPQTPRNPLVNKQSFWHSRRPRVSFSLGVYSDAYLELVFGVIWL